MCRFHNKRFHILLVTIVGSILWILFQTLPAFGESPTPSPVDKPYEQDPLHIAAHISLTTPPSEQVWKVFTCDVGTGYYLPDATAAVNNWGPAVTEWFHTASNGTYNPVFVPMKTILHNSLYYKCSDDAFNLLTEQEKKDGVGTIVLHNKQLGDPDCPAHEDCPINSTTGEPLNNTGALGYGLTGSWVVENGYVIRKPLVSQPRALFTGGGVDQAYREGLITHELGHTFGWHHVPYTTDPVNEYANPTDVMSGIRFTETHVFNRYRAGWLAASQVIEYNEAGTFTVGYQNSDEKEMLIVRSKTEGILYAVGVHTGNLWPGYPQTPETISAGVTILKVDQSTGYSNYRWHNHCPQTSQGTGACFGLSALTQNFVPEKTEAWTPFTYQTGAIIELEDVTIVVKEQTETGYVLSITGMNDSIIKETIRIEGGNRYETAAAISKKIFNQASTVFIATGENYPDVLSAAPAAGHDKAPVLYVQKNVIPTSTKQELLRLQPDKIIIVGGTGAISTTVEKELTLFTNTIVRYAGNNRYETAAKISQETFLETTDTAYVAVGTNFVDALAAGPAAIIRNAPLLLTETTNLPPATRTELLRLNLETIIIVGGTSAISEQVATELTAYADTVIRLGGSNRWETAQRISADTFPATGSQTIYVTTGYGWADSAVGAAAASQIRGPILLTSLNSVPLETKKELERLRPPTIIIFGGRAVISSETENQFMRLQRQY